MPIKGLRRIRFSLMSLMLFAALVCVSISHFRTSWSLDKTQVALRTANNELGYLTIDDPKQICAIALPTFGPMQWRWRLHLPPGKRYQLRWAINNVPESDLPAAPGVNKLALLDAAAKPIATKEPFVFILAIHKNDAGQWLLNAVLPERGEAMTIKVVPEWLDGDRIGWTERTAGRDQTEACDGSGPLALLRYRKGKQVPPNGWTVDMQPTDGIAVWIEEVSRK
jgi:hypothetical protein